MLTKYGPEKLRIRARFTQCPSSIFDRVSECVSDICFPVFSSFNSSVFLDGLKLEGKNLPSVPLLPKFRCVNKVQIQSFFWIVFSKFSPNKEKYGPEKTSYLNTFHAVLSLSVNTTKNVGRDNALDYVSTSLSQCEQGILNKDKL